MRRLAGGERSTRFEPASQHSQLPSPGETKSQDRGKPGGVVWTARKAPRRDAGTEQSEPGTGEKKTVSGRQTTHQEVGQATVSGV